ncbi:MAG TPA: prepilin-type N-terminal cleavage/methylation domain-containing protein [Verrucomicrobiae bacterium]|nr:prepilin-type N-terminal cleavage/methylation domain-containing protein [Verrucomicrobiae bacterium]
MKPRKLLRKQRGFTLLETMIAMAILSFGVLSLASFYTAGLKSSSLIKVQYIANQKAQQALESIYTARDTNTLAFSQIANISQGGVFKDGPQPLLAPGPDGIVGTSDDDASNPDVIFTGPGPDNILGTADDTYIPLNPWMTRTIAIQPVPNYTSTMMQVTITITYVYQGQSGQVQLVTYVSSYS